MTIKNVCNALKTIDGSVGKFDVMCMLLENNYSSSTITKPELKQFLVKNNIHGNVLFEGVCSVFKINRLK